MIILINQINSDVNLFFFYFQKLVTQLFLIILTVIYIYKSEKILYVFKLILHQSKATAFDLLKKRKLTFVQINIGYSRMDYSREREIYLL